MLQAIKLKLMLCLLFFIPLTWAEEVTWHNHQSKEWLLTNAIVVVGVGTPAEGPYDIHVVDGVIKHIEYSIENSELRQKVRDQLDVNGSYVLPGFINMHAHIMHSRAGIEMPQPYQYYLWLASGITTIRDLSSDLDRSLEDKKRSARHQIIAPRMFVYAHVFGNHQGEMLDKKMKTLLKKDIDGFKLRMMDKATFKQASAFARKHNKPVAHHVGVEDMTAWDNVEAGTTSIEHWYGIPDAALEGVQNFPAEMNYSNELHRFRFAGRLWNEAQPEKLEMVLDAMAEKGVAWDPTLVIYEASRDLQRAVTSPWFQDYLHPGLEKYFKPNADSHGSFFLGWTSEDETHWKNNYQIWFKALRYFANHGGTIVTGEDGGYIYQLYGFGYLRELQLHQEAGFHPLEVIKHATVNSAKVLGQGDRLGQIRIGYVADLVVVNGNPLENFQVLLPRDIKPITGDESTGGITWTIKDGVPYHVPTMLKEVRNIVIRARKDHAINYLVEGR